jgi:PBP1b-binding outer membrane lipoprotein LpoB
MVSCQTRSVTRITPETQIDLSGRWNDSDSRMVADKMINDLFASERFKEYARENGKKPTIIVGLIRNKTSEHIDAANYIKKFELAIYNSNVADLVESDEFRDQLRKERAEQQDFADPATMANNRVVNYITTLFLTDIETNKRVWYGQHEIKKLVKN